MLWRLRQVGRSDLLLGWRGLFARQLLRRRVRRLLTCGHVDPSKSICSGRTFANIWVCISRATFADDWPSRETLQLTEKRLATHKNEAQRIRRVFGLCVAKPTWWSPSRGTGDRQSNHVREDARPSQPTFGARGPSGNDSFSARRSSRALRESNQ